MEKEIIPVKWPQKTTKKKKQKTWQRLTAIYIPTKAEHDEDR